MEGEKMLENKKPLSPEEQEILEQEEKKKENWKEKVAEMTSLSELVFAGISELLEEGIIEDEFGLISYIPSILKPALQDYVGVDVDLRKYALYHELFGSSPLYEWSPELDLPDNQIINFTKELLEKISIAKETGEFEI